MVCDLQKASMWKRISAFLFDGIILAVLAVALASVLSMATGYDRQSQALEEHYDRYEAQYGVTFQITGEEYAAMSPEQQAQYDAAYHALISDEEVLYVYNVVINLTMTITTLGILLAFLILEFAVPLLLGNGQTLGKKIFALAVVRTDTVRMNNMQLFTRTVLGKFTIETMIPVYVMIMIFFNSVGIFGTFLLLVLLIIQAVLLIVTRENRVLHDLLAGTVVVDYPSQRIFRSTEELIEYTKKVHAERAARQPY